ncbi:MAG TPA: alpha-1,4-glucan--maltose-1-phosphate maltosyltransferase [Candidatus Binatia bacterium]|nr:alpha-1,4-glucan--maltose-1-phosphate maltosyltransferase [Candidatus Binatia bacterium]
MAVSVARPGVPHRNSMHDATKPAESPPRVVIDRVTPEIDAGRFPTKRVLGDEVTVGADVFTEGHDRLVAVLRVRGPGDDDWREVPMTALVNDRWEATFTVDRLGPWECAIDAWVDEIATWRAGLVAKRDAGLDVASELLEGAALLERASTRADGPDRAWLAEHARLVGGSGEQATRAAAAMSPALTSCALRFPDRTRATRWERTLRIAVEPERAVYGAWYEMFPRSASSEPDRHGTFADVVQRLPYVAGMGFDVLYLPPIHPIGRTHRKGRNNLPVAGPDDPGSPWGIGAAEGGHTAIHPSLGTLGDFDRLVTAAREHGLDVALDLAFQCSPDHPWVTEHPQWFRHRPDGTIQYAENPPKKYQDIYPIHFETDDWRALWDGLRDVVLFWVARGVRIFRVDNPHTKPFAFWEWMIAEVRAAHPDVFFLAEAFTRPAVMRHLAKVGFSQSYSYFTWRNTKAELTAWMTELVTPPVSDYMRPNLFVNTPDILHEYLQIGGRPAFQIRSVLAATLGATWGVYGPPFELIETASSGGEDYLDGEKYQQRHWDVERPDSLRPFIARLNRIRRDNPALHRNDRLRFLPVDNDRLLAYVKTTPDLSNQVLVVVTVDPHHRQTGWIELPLDALGLDATEAFQVHDLVSDARFLWDGPRAFVAIDPAVVPAHVFRIRRRLRTEKDFDYFL